MVTTHGRWIIKKGALKTRQIHLYTGPMANNEVYRVSQLIHGWAEERVKYLDYISREASIPINKKDCCVNDLITNHQQMLLSAFNELKAKEYLIFQCICGQDRKTHWI